MVKYMLEDPILRYETARGLVNQSGSLDFYHEDHTEKQKLQWFEAVASKLLDFRFKYDDFDRYLSAFDKQYPNLTINLKLELLSKLDGYVSENNDQSSDLVFTIDRLTFDNQPTLDEQKILLSMIGKLEPVAKADLLFRFAARYKKLPNKSFAEVISRPFYVEAPHELMLERGAVLLGLLSSPGKKKDKTSLPLPLQGLSNNFDDAIEKYISSQSDEFKLAILFQIVGYHILNGHGEKSKILIRNSLVKRLFKDFLRNNTKYRLFVADVLLNDAYYYLSENKYEWYKYIEIIFSIEDVDFQKQICNILFSYNVASSLHNIEDWINLLLRFLTHPNQEIKMYAVSMFDKNFKDVLKDVYVFSENKEWREKFKDTWFNDAFYKFLVDNAPTMKMYFEVRFFEDWLDKNWEQFSSSEKMEHIETLITKAITYEINESISEFFEKMRSRLSVVEQKTLEDAVRTGNGTAPAYIRQHEEYFARRKNLHELEPKFDWSIFLGKTELGDIKEDEF